MGVANWVTAIRESFLHENLIFKQFAKVFTRERYPLYGTTLHPTDSFHILHDTVSRGQHSFMLPAFAVLLSLHLFNMKVICIHMHSQRSLAFDVTQS